MASTAIFGSVFVDVKGFPFEKYIPTATNVGDIKIVHGGVSRNVAENMANIGQSVSFITMFDVDAIGEDVRQRLFSRGVDVRNAVKVPSGMGMWLAVMDENGDLAGSVSKQPDFRALEALIDREGDRIVRDCANIVLEIDTTAPIAGKVFDLAEKYNKDVYVVVGNMAVILRHPEMLSRTRLFILNEIEAGRLFERNLEDLSPAEVQRIMIEEAEKRGMQELIITMGGRGAAYYDSISGDTGIVPAEQVQMVDSTGAGDAFFSGTVAARMNGCSLEEAARLGTHLAALTLQTEESTCPCIRNFLSATA